MNIKINNDIVEADSTGMFDLGTVVREHQQLVNYATNDKFVIVFGDEQWSAISGNADPNKFYFITEH